MIQRARLSIARRQLLTYRGSIIEQNNSLRLPPDARLKVVTSNHVVQEKINQQLRLGVFHALDLSYELPVEKEGFPAGDGVDSHYRVDSVNGVFTDQATDLANVSDHL